MTHQKAAILWKGLMNTGAVRNSNIMGSYRIHFFHKIRCNTATTVANNLKKWFDGWDLPGENIFSFHSFSFLSLACGGNTWFNPICEKKKTYLKASLFKSYHIRNWPNADYVWRFSLYHADISNLHHFTEINLHDQAARINLRVI